MNVIYGFPDYRDKDYEEQESQDDWSKDFSSLQVSHKVRIRECYKKERWALGSGNSRRMILFFWLYPPGLIYSLIHRF